MTEHFRPFEGPRFESIENIRLFIDDQRYPLLCSEYVFLCENWKMSLVSVTQRKIIIYYLTLRNHTSWEELEMHTRY